MVTVNGGVRKIGSARRVGEMRGRDDSSRDKRAVPAPPSLSTVNDSRKKEAGVRAAAKKNNDVLRSRSRSPGDLTRLPNGLVLKRSSTPQAHKRTSSVTPNAPARTSSVRGARNSPRAAPPNVPVATTRELIRGASASPMFLRQSPISQTSESSRSGDRSYLKEVQHLKQQLLKVTNERDALQLQIEAQRIATGRMRANSQGDPALSLSVQDDALDGMDKDIINNYGITFTDLAVNMEEVLGSGGFGMVYKGDYQATEVAVKIHRGDKAWTEEELDAWQREVKIMTMLRHPNVLMLLGAVFEKGRPAIITEYCESGTLQQFLVALTKRNAQIKWGRKLKWMTEIAKGMAFLHHKNIFHRDLKSSNVFVCNDTMKIADFGLSISGSTSRRMRQEGEKKEQSLIQGTFAFMAPEVWAELPYTEACDVYSFGVLTIELMALDIPFERDFRDDCSWRIMTYKSKPRVLKKIGGVDVPEPMQEIIEMCLAKPANRPIFTALVAILRAETQSAYASTISPWPSSRYDSWVGVSCSDWPADVPDPLSVTMVGNDLPNPI